MSGPHLSFQVVLGIDDLQTHTGADGLTVITDPRWSGADWQEERITPPAIPPYDELEARTPHDSRVWNYWLTQQAVACTVSDADGHGLPFTDLLHWSPEYGSPRVLGLRIRRSLYDEAALHAMALLHPEYQESGWKRLPLRPIGARPSQDTLAYQRAQAELIAAGGGGAGIVALRRWVYDSPSKESRQARRRMVARAARLGQEHKRGWDNGYGLHMLTWGPTATYVLRAAGLDVQQWDLRLMLVWEWR